MRGYTGRHGTTVNARGRRCRMYGCAETGRVYASAEEAAAECGTTRSAVYHSARRARPTSAGLHFYRACREDEPVPPGLLDCAPPRAMAASRGTPVVCDETGETWPDAASAAASAGVSPKSVMAACASGRTAGGLHWRRAGTWRPTRPDGRKRPVTCVDAGIAFGSVAEAAAWAGVATGTLSRALAAGRPCAGHVFARGAAIGASGPPVDGDETELRHLGAPGKVDCARLAQSGQEGECRS